MRALVRSGQLEFVNGGWSMHDEACTHYEDMINNMMKGHWFLLEEFGYRPKYGWHIDPFGHSSANARLFADMGFDAWFFARLDFQDKEKRMKDESMQFVWRPFSEHLGKSAQIFTHVMMNHYNWPTEFHIDDMRDDDPVVVDEGMETFNADKKVELMKDYINEYL